MTAGEIHFGENDLKTLARELKARMDKYMSMWAAVRIKVRSPESSRPANRRVCCTKYPCTP